MGGHGFETYWIEGEGELSVSGDGRPDPLAARAVDDGDRVGPLDAEFDAAATAAVPPFRFSRIGPRGKPLSKQNLTKIAEAMIGERGGATGIPAGYTYVGQFIDHDLTFDVTTVTLGEKISPNKMLQGRSPTLDLDSLYGAGPGDPESSRFYADDLHLKVGSTLRIGPDRARDGFDLPRGEGRGRRRKRRAIIPDKRNDENLAVAQTHLAMIKFHNRVVDRLPKSVPQAQRFEDARRKVVKHYQWMIRHDYLPRICKASVLDDVFRNGRKIFEVGVPATQMPTMPVEFSVAAYRLGHSMIRSDYSWNKRFPDDIASLDLLFTFSGLSGDLNGQLRLTSDWICDFRRLYDFEEAGRTDLAAPRGQFNKARRIDTMLVNPLKNLPTGSIGGPPLDFDDPRANLAFRNLVRAKGIKLATGQQMAQLLSDAGVPVTPLTPGQILDGRRGARLDRLTQTEKDALVERTPLWFYILREAEFNRGKLDGVGARIVAETFHRAMEGSTYSIVRHRRFRPHLGPDDSTFRMVDLLLFAHRGRAGQLNPLG